MSYDFDGDPISTRVAVIAYHSSPLIEPGWGDAGGMTVYVRELAQALARRGIHTDIFTRLTTNGPRLAQLSERVRVVGIEAGPRALLTKKELPRYIDDFSAGVRAFATSQRVVYDIVHSHYWQSGVAGIELSRVWDAPLVHSQHSLAKVKNSRQAPGDLPEPSSRIEGEHEVMSGADVLIASTDDEWQQLSCLYGAPHDGIKIIHPGVDHSRFHPADRHRARRALGIDQDDAVMLFVGRIQRLKGLELAVCSARSLVSSLDRPLSFIVVGGGSGPGGEEELERVRGLVETLDLGSCVRFVGPRPHRALPAFYRAADVLAVSSYSESFGLAALEAHACGTPVVGTAVGGLSYIVRDGQSGHLLEERDPAAFAERMRDVVGNVGRWPAFSRAAVDSAAEFSWERTAAETLTLYDCLVRDRTPEVCTC